MTNVPHAAAQDLVGIPFVVGGRDFRPIDGGTDCLGAILELCRRVGLRVEDPWQWLSARWDGNVRGALPDWLEEVPAGTPLEVGDIGITTDGGHVVGFAGGGYVLEAVHNGGTRLSALRKCPVSSWWRSVA